MESNFGQQVRYWNRKLKRNEEENIYGEKMLRWVYGARMGQILLKFITKPFFSKAVGVFMDSTLSRSKINRFIKKFSIPINEFESASYVSFNDFFIRKFKSGVRIFVSDSAFMPAFCEARYLAFEKLDISKGFPVKGQLLTVNHLLSDKNELKYFSGGPAFIARLCPTDYHRFHFPDNGKVISRRRIRGKFDSVSPVALNKKNDIFCTNERQISILETQNFGKLAFVEVGATCVGKIVQTHTQDEFLRGEEKGYFLFGGSTVIILGEPGWWVPDKDILDKTADGVESLITLGEQIARKLG